MRLLRVEDGGNFSLIERIGNNIPRYAILSHTWGEDEGEVSFRDLMDGIGRSKAGYRKICFCSEQAAKDGLEYFWVDTCCIDKSSSTELQEAINSMFQWYRKADKCYVYLSDVSISDFAQTGQSFQKSRWFTRGWTLQELVAPTCVEFFSLEGERIGDKNSMAREIQSITGIPIQALQQIPLSHFSAEERLSWAENRETRREEDAAYSLLGIFDIHMPLLYGEGQTKAFARLKRKMEKSCKDRSSILPLSTLSTEQSEYKLGTFAPRPSGENPDSVEQSDIPGILNACMDALEHSEVYKDFGVALRYALPEFGDSKSRLKARENVVGISNGKRKEIHDSRPTGKDPEAILKRISSYAHNNVDAYERTRPRLCNDSEAREETFTDIPGVPRKNIKNMNKALLTAPTRGGLEGASTSGGKFVHQIEKLQDAINTLSNLVTLIDPQPQLMRRSTELGDHLNDEPNLDKIEYAGAQKACQLLLEIQRAVKLQSQNTVNDWLEITKFDDRYSVAQYYDKQATSCLEGTCEWVFFHPAYDSWISADNPNETARILWIFAPPGYGKTVLCARIVEHIKNKQSFLVAYFFASPHAQSGGDPSFIIRSWIAQIANLDPDILELVRRHSEAGQRASESDIWLIFGSIASENRNYVFVLDGFDEYSRVDNIRTGFLQRLKKATNRTASRILITSRYETDIEAEFRPKMAQNAGHVILQCRITNEDVRHDLSLFSKRVVDEKLPRKDDRLRQDLAGQLTEKCEGMFLWIKLQQDQLRGGKNAKQLQNIVKNMPIGLMNTYERNWKTIQNHCPADRNRALSILKWTTFAFRPLTISEITGALIVEPDYEGTTLQWDDLPDNIDDDYINSEIIDICGGLVEARAEKPGGGAGFRTIHLIHPSVREFLLLALSPTSIDTTKPCFGSNQTPGQAEQHEYLTIVCLGYLNSDDTWERYRANDDSEHGYDFVNYAARNWNSHIIAAGRDNAKLLCLVEEFFQPENGNFIQWGGYIESPKAAADSSREGDKGAPTPLYYAALFDLPAIMEHIWANDATQLNKVGGEYGTPLQAACFKGHQSVFQLLLGWGADPNGEGGKFGIPINAAIAGGQKSMAKALIDRVVNHTLQDSMGRTPLYIAAMNGDSEVVNWLIEAGADQTTRNKYGWTPLGSAAANGHPEVLKLLLENEADITVASNDGWTPLNSAADNGYLEVVKLLLKNRADIAVASNSGWTPLNTAASNGHLEVVKLLLENRADTATANKYGWTPLHTAASSGYLEVVKLLLENRADTAAANKYGWTPLNTAAGNGHFEVVKLLLENGADIAAASDDGWTPLNIAASNGHLEVVKLLLENRVDTTTASKYGWTPLNTAASNGHLEVVKLLLENRADTATANKYGWTPLNTAAGNGHLEVVKLLLENGADIAAASDDGWTPLNMAANNGHLEVVQLLLENRADTATANKYGWTPLNTAAINGHLEVMKLLLENGADIAAASDDGWTPLDMAANNGHLEVVQLLLENGADSAVASNSGWTPLTLAANRDHLEIVKLLLLKGSTDINGFDTQYGTIWNFLAFKGYTDLLRFCYEQYDANIHPAEPHGRTPLQLAARGGHIDTFEYLISLGLDPTSEDIKGDNVLWYAASSGSLEVLNAVLNKGFKCPSQSRHWSPLHWACRAGIPDVVELLIKEGSNSECVTVPQPEGQWSPLSIAIFHGKEEMLRNLSTSCRSLLGVEVDAVRLHGERHGGYWCNGCLHVSG